MQIGKEMFCFQTHVLRIRTTPHQSWAELLRGVESIQKCLIKLWLACRTSYYRAQRRSREPGLKQIGDRSRTSGIGMSYYGRCSIHESLEITDFVQIQVRLMDRWSVYAAELIGVLYSINIINTVALHTGKHLVYGCDLPQSLPTVCQDYRPSRTLGTCRKNRSNMSFSKELRTPRPTV